MLAMEVSVSLSLIHIYRYQADQAAAANSLLGGENVVDIATTAVSYTHLDNMS